MTRLSISLLGPLQIALDGEPITDFATDKAQALLIYLAVESDRPHRRDELAGLLWPDQPQRNARHSLRQALSHLRSAITDRAIIGDCSDRTPFLLVSRETVELNPDCDHWLDVTAFTALVEECGAHRHRRLGSCLPCMRRLEKVAALYRGEFLEHFFLSDSSSFEEWALLKREWFRREAVESLFHLASYHERRGAYEQARVYAQRQVALEPWREEAHRQLMRLLALDGQHSAALVQYETCRRSLAKELGVEPTAETEALYKWIRATRTASAQVQEHEHSPPPPRISPPSHNLPSPPTPLVGRGEELAEIAELLANPACRLVTIFGPGGIGKTHLALQAAEEHIGAFKDGVAFVSFASISSAEHLVAMMMEALGIPPRSSQVPQEQLLNFLRAKEMLLVLDNMEHVVEGSTLLPTILARAPGTVLLVTSRERLNLQQEWVYEIRGLTYPEDGTEGEEETYSALDLFQQQARRANWRATFSEAELHAAARICRLVEGMPLGIELAAARVAVQSCEEIAQEIEHNLDILTTRLRNVPERHQSMRAAFEHSWGLLTETEKGLFARLSVFRGGFRREAATAVAGASLSTLSALLDQSLIRRIPPDRYEMHELLRQYAAEKLQANAEEEKETRARHARTFSAFLAREEPHLRGANQRQALLAIAREVENARQAWQLAASRGWVHQVGQSLDSMYHFFVIRCRFQEGLELFAQVTDQWSGELEQTPVFARVVSRQGVLYRHLGRYREARICLEQSLAVFKHLDMPTERGFCLINLASVARHLGRYKETEQLARESLALSREHDDCWGISSSLFLLGSVRYHIGDIDRAETILEESLAAGRKSSSRRLIMSPLNMLGDIACHRGDYTRGQAVFEECLALSREIGDQYHVAMHLNNLGTVFHVLERYAQARPFYQESLEICRKIGDQTGQAIALSNLGEVAYALGAHSRAQQFYQEGLAIGRDIQDPWTVMACLNNLGEIARALEDCQTARDYFTKALKIATETQTLTVLLKVLVNLAALFAQQNQRDRAAALLGLARGHPATERATQERAERMLGEMGLAVPEGTPRPLDEVVAEILAEIPPDAP